MNLLYLLLYVSSEYATASAGLYLPVNMWSMWWFRPSSEGRQLWVEKYFIAMKLAIVLVKYPFG